MKLLLAAVLLYPVLALGQTCTVTSVHDGDSMRVRCPGQKKTFPIRLDQIDAPELQQAHGKASRDYLRALCPVGRPAIIEPHGKDRYDRTLATVTCDGLEANAAMVASGSAWVYEQYLRDESLLIVQARARETRTGLWSRPNATAPWTYRRNQAR